MGIIGLIMLRTTRVAFCNSNGKFNESFSLNINALAEAMGLLCVRMCVRACLRACTYMCTRFLSQTSELISYSNMNFYLGPRGMR
jgi:hypothetical protein